jgi:hypothetical protein
MPYLSPAYKVIFVLVITVSVSPKEPEDELFGRDVNTCKNKMTGACHLYPNIALNMKHLSYDSKHRYVNHGWLVI